MFSLLKRVILKNSKLVLVILCVLISALLSNGFVSTQKEVIIIDAGVQDVDLLLKGVIRDADIHLLNTKTDAIPQITDILKPYNSISALHLISHGGNGHLILANKHIDVRSLSQHTAQLKQWHHAFNQDGQILLYGCEVAENQQGRLFVDKLSELTSLTLLSSNNITGNTTLSADATFEYIAKPK